MRVNIINLRSVLDLDGADLVEAPLHDVLALQHELASLSLEVLLLPHCDPELTHLLHLLSVHGCCFSRRGYSLVRAQQWTAHFRIKQVIGAGFQRICWPKMLAQRRHCFFISHRICKVTLLKKGKEVKKIK